MTSPNIPVLCSVCHNVMGFNEKGVLTCRAFKGGIPSDILSGEFDHRFEHEGDEGILFEIKSDVKLNQVVQDVFDKVLKLNYRCKKEEQVGEGPGSCGGKVRDKIEKLPKETRSKKAASIESKKAVKKEPKKKAVVESPVTFGTALKAEHIVSNPEINAVVSDIQLKFNESDEIERQYQKIDINKSTSKQRHSMIEKIENLRKERNSLIANRDKMIKDLVLKDLAKMTPEQRREYRDTKQKEMQASMSVPPTNIKDRVVFAVTMEQFYTAEEYIRNDRVDAKSDEFKHRKFKSLSDAEKELASKITIGEDVSDRMRNSISVDTMNQIGKERARLFIEYPELRNIEIKNIELVDRALGSHLGQWEYTKKTLSMHYNSSKVDKKTKLGGGRTWNKAGYGTGVDTESVFRHEMGHAVSEQLLTNDEQASIRMFWMDNDLGSDNGPASAYNPIRYNIRTGVSSYATTNPDELFAEMFCVMSAGYQINRDICPPAHDAISRILKKREEV